jgi:hypothetical protein
MQAHMTYKALNKTLELAATISLTCIQFAFSLFSGLSAAEDVKISASQVWLGSYASSHLISSYIYVAYGYILAGTIKTINYISTGYKLRLRRDYN